MEVIVVDIETIKGCFLLCAYKPEDNTYHDFLINESENDLYSMIKFLDSHKDYYMVTYNGLNFDGQVIEYIWRTYDKWFEKSSKDIAYLIWEKAQEVIDDTNYGLFPPYRESELTFKQLDIFRINHYDNKNRMVSLKRLEYELDLENIEEMSVKHDKKNFTEQEVKDLVHYCRNDVYATYEFYKVTIGDTEHPLYKGNNQIQLRKDIQEEFGIECLNYSNSKIGDEIIKKYYCEEKAIEYKDLPRKGFFRREIKLKHCIPNYVKFKTKQLQSFLKETKDTVLKSNEDFIKSITFYGQTYTFAKGGLHNVINNKSYTSSEDEDLIDIDVSGFYPASIINNNYYPFHLGKEFLVGYKKVYFKRLELKPLAKKDKKIKGIVAALKEGGNCPYGKSSDMTSWLYDKQMTLATCITGEMSLLMFIEDCELNNIKCIMANTDGATFIVPKNLREKFNEIKANWLQATSLELTYELEEVLFKKMIFSSVNDYIAIKEDGSVKYKGDYMTDFELHKNKSFRVIPLALSAYFLEDKNPDEFIRNHKNIYDFCGRAKASRDFHYEGLNKETNDVTTYNKLIRYFVSDKGLKLLKIKNPECQTNAAELSEVHAGEWLCTVCNQLKKTDVHHFSNINYTFYIDKAMDIINNVNAGKKVKKKIINPMQTTLF